MSAARRPAGLTKHLARLGHRVTVLTSAMSGSGGVPGAARTIRTRDLLVSPLNWRRASLTALKGEARGAYSGQPSTLAGWVIPDLELVGWVPFALPRALSLLHTERFECVITSSPPQSGHLIGLALQRRGIPWVADLRDGWSFEPSGERFPRDSRRRQLDAMLERAVLRRADALVAVTPPIAEDLRRRVNPQAVTITNGYDPDELRAAREAAALAPVIPGRYTMAYTGTLAFGGASPASLLDAIRLLREETPELGERLDLVFAGPTASAELADLQAPDLKGNVRTLGSIPRLNALGLQHAADALLLVVDSRRPSIATGKLYEYLSAGRPILVLGEGSVAARIVRDVGAGTVAPVDDPPLIAAALRDLMQRAHSEERPARAALDQFSYAQLADEMAGQVELAINRSHADRGQVASSRRRPVSIWSGACLRSA